MTILGGLDFLLHPLLGRSIAVDTIPEPAHIITSIAATLGGIVVGTLLMPGSPKQRQRVRRFMDGVDAQPAAPDPTKAASAPPWSPARVVGISIGALGAMLLAVVLLMVPLGESVLSLGVGGGMLTIGCILAGWPRRRGGPKPPRQ